MIILKILLWLVAAIAGYFLCCAIVGFVLGVAKGLGIWRRPRFRVIRCEEETE